MSKKQNVYGEGNYAASRRYYADTKKFVESGRSMPPLAKRRRRRLRRLPRCARRRRLHC